MLFIIQSGFIYKVKEGCRIRIVFQMLLTKKCSIESVITRNSSCIYAYYFFHMQSNISSFCINNVFLKCINLTHFWQKWCSILIVGHKFLTYKRYVYITFYSLANEVAKGIYSNATVCPSVLPSVVLPSITSLWTL